MKYLLEGKYDYQMLNNYIFFLIYKCIKFLRSSLTFNIFISRNSVLSHKKVAMSPLDLNKLKKRTLPDDLKQPKKRINRFNGLSEEEIQKHTLKDYLEINLDIVVIGINPSLMSAYHGRYYAGPGNHFYKLLYESGLIPKSINFEEDYKLLQYGIGLTNIVERATRSAADLKRTEIKEGAKIVEEKLKLYKPKIAVFNGRCIYDVFANITNKSTFCFGLQPKRIDNTAIWVTPSSSARCVNFPRLIDKLHFYTALKKYLHFLKGEISNIDIKEIWFERKYEKPVPSTSKMWRRKNVSTFLHGGKIVNKNTLCHDVSDQDITSICVTEFSTEEIKREDNVKDKNTLLNTDMCNKKNENQTILNEIIEKTEMNIREEVSVENINDEALVDKDSKSKDILDMNRKDCRINTLNNKDNMINYKKNRKYAYPESIHKTQKTTQNNNNNSPLDFMNLIKKRLSQKTN